MFQDYWCVSLCLPSGVPSQKRRPKVCRLKQILGSNSKVTKQWKKVKRRRTKRMVLVWILKMLLRRDILPRLENLGGWWRRAWSLMRYWLCIGMPVANRSSPGSFAQSWWTDFSKGPRLVNMFCAWFTWISILEAQHRPSLGHSEDRGCCIFHNLVEYIPWLRERFSGCCSSW